MKNVILLTKILLKGSSTQFKESNSKKSNEVGKVIFFLLVYLYIAGFVGYISYQSIKSLMQINQESIFLNICFVGMFGFSIIQAVIASLNVLFFSKDSEFLLPLPIKAEKIVMAKLNCIIVSQYLMCSIILLPILIVYGILLKASVAFYVISLLIVLLFPIIPVTLTAFIVTVIMKFTNIVKNKDFVQYLTVIITILLIVSIQLMCGNTSNEITSEELANKLMKTNNVVEEYSIFFITLNPIINAILNNSNIYGLINIIILFIESFAIYMIMVLIISKLYIKSAISAVSSGIKNKKKIKEKTFTENSTVVSYVKKELKILNRNPIFFMQCVLPSILFPVIISLPIFMTFKDWGIEETKLFQEQIGTLINTPIGLAGILISIIFLFTFNFASVTSISRDGNYAIFMKYIPVELSNQCLYKIIPGIILNIIPIMYIIVISKIFIVETTLKIIVYTIFISMLVNILNNYLMIIVDLKNPKLKWMTEYAVVKQNFNMFFEILISAVEIVLVIFIAINISNVEIFVVIIIAILLLLNLVISKYINKNNLNLFKKII